MANEKFTVVGTNIQEKASVIWNVADLLRGPFKPHEYGLVILPMAVIKRFHDCLLPTHDKVLDLPWWAGNLFINSEIIHFTMKLFPSL